MGALLVALRHIRCCAALPCETSGRYRKRESGSGGRDRSPWLYSASVVAFFWPPTIRPLRSSPCTRACCLHQAWMSEVVQFVGYASLHALERMTHRMGQISDTGLVLKAVCRFLRSGTAAQF